MKNTHKCVTWILLLFTPFVLGYADSSDATENQTPPETINIKYSRPGDSNSVSEITLRYRIVDESTGAGLYFDDAIDSRFSYASFEEFLNDYYDEYVGGIEDEGNNTREFLDFLQVTGLDWKLFLARFKTDMAAGVSLAQFMDFVEMLDEIKSEGDDLNHILNVFDEPLFLAKNFLDVLDVKGKSTRDFAIAAKTKALSYNELHAAMVLYDADPDTNDEQKKISLFLDYLFCEKSVNDVQNEDPDLPTDPKKQAEKLGLYINNYSWNIIYGRKATSQKEATRINVLSQSDKNPDNYSNVINELELWGFAWVGGNISYRFEEGSGAINRKLRGHTFTKDNAMYAEAKIYTALDSAYVNASIVKVDSFLYHDVIYCIVDVKATQQTRFINIPLHTHTMEFQLSARDGFINPKWDGVPDYNSETSGP